MKTTKMVSLMYLVTKLLEKFEVGKTYYNI